jgi:hypothetical protein
MSLDETFVRINPGKKSGDCLEFSTGANRKWDYIACSEKRQFICKSKRDLKLACFAKETQLTPCMSCDRHIHGSPCVFRGTFLGY